MIKRKNRRNDRAVDKRQGTVLIVDRIPIAVEEEFQAEGVPGEVGIGN